MKRNRRGYSLIETLVVILLTGTTLTVAAVTMHALHRAQHRLRDDQQSQRALEQLAFQVRQDAHAASSATLGETTETRSRTVTLVGSNGQNVEYSSSRTGIDRVARRGDMAVHREHFRLTAAAESSWTIDASLGRSVLILHLPRSAGNSQSAPGPQHTPTIRAIVDITSHSSRALPSQSRRAGGRQPPDRTDRTAASGG